VNCRFISSLPSSVVIVDLSGNRFTEPVLDLLHLSDSARLLMSLTDSCFQAFSLPTVTKMWRGWMCPCIQSLMVATTTSLLLVERRWLSLSRLRAVKLRGCSELTRIHPQFYRVDRFTRHCRWQFQKCLEIQMLV